MADRIKEEILNGLSQRFGNKHIPFTLLYDETGSNLFEEITTLPEYYLTSAELQLFKKHALEIARNIGPGTVFVELGCGSAKKTLILLRAIKQIHGRCRYIGIDVSGTALKEAIANLNEFSSPKDDIEFIEQDYEQALRVVRDSHPQDHLCIAWLGSSIGNFSLGDSISFIKHLISIAQSNCKLLLSMDMWKESTTLNAAYNDTRGVTGKFIINGMRKALSNVGCPPQNDDFLSYQLSVNKELKRVEMYVVFNDGLTIQDEGLQIREGERVMVEFSTKYTVEDVRSLATQTSCQVLRCWGDPAIYTCQLLVPAIHALQQCWTDTDVLFKSIPNWNYKPIDLRHPYLFYYGHMAAFAKLKLLDLQEGEEMDEMFSRGMDPNVTDPSRCHNHPPVPKTWPSKETVEEYVKQVRQMIRDMASSKGRKMVKTRMWSFLTEHERMHQETLTYMLAQHVKQDFQARKLTQENGVVALVETNLDAYRVSMPDVTVEGGDVLLGVDPTETTVFVWDNEAPRVARHVDGQFKMSSKAVTVKDWTWFVNVRGGYKDKTLWGGDQEFKLFSAFGCPATWTMTDRGDFYVHDNVSSMHCSKVAEKPVYVSLAEAEAFCRAMGGGIRVMTEEEYELALKKQDDSGVDFGLRDGGWEWTRTPFAPFPGFSAMPEYPEYSEDFFDGEHFVLKGSSLTTHISLHRDSFRNFYQRKYPYVFAKFRLCIDA